jgi:hypothetical protein
MILRPHFHLLLSALLLCARAGWAQQTLPLSGQIQSGDSDIHLFVQPLQEPMGDISKLKQVSVVVGVTNISNDSVTIEDWGGNHSIKLYTVNNSMEKTLVFPAHPTGYYFRTQVELFPSETCFFKVNIPAKIILSGKRLVASTFQDKKGTIDKVCEVFSEPFDLSLPRDYRGIKVSVVVNKESMGDITKLTKIQFTVMIQNNGDEIAPFFNSGNNQGLIIYSLSESGEKTPIFPADPSAEAGSGCYMDIASGKSYTIKAYLPAEAIPLGAKKFVVSFTKGSSPTSKTRMFFSQPFSLPGLGK